MKMKKRLCFFLAALLMLSLCLVGCDPETDAPAPSGADGGDAVTDEGGEGTEEQEFWVQRGDIRLFGRIYIPDTPDARKPAVILSHSSSMTADSMQSYCRGFVSRGYVAYAFDFAGGSSKSRSDGEEDDMTVFTEVEDLKAVLSTIRALPYVDAERVYLFGTSQGGLVSALTAEECPDAVAGLLLLYPAFNIAELVQRFSGLGLSSGNAYMETLQNYDVYEHIGSFPGRVLILRGSRDFIVPSSAVERAAALYEHCELYTIDGANHGFNSENYSFGGDFDPQVWEYIDAYLEET